MNHNPRSYLIICILLALGIFFSGCMLTQPSGNISTDRQHTAAALTHIDTADSRQKSLNSSRSSSAESAFSLLQSSAVTESAIGENSDGSDISSGLSEIEAFAEKVTFNVLRIPVDVAAAAIPDATTETGPSAIPGLSSEETSVDLLSADPATTPETAPTAAPTAVPTPRPTAVPTPRPTAAPTPKPTAAPVTSISTTVSTGKIVLTTLLGKTEAQIITMFGQPKSKELSEYGFKWYVFNSDYKRFIMIGIAAGKVVGVYSNSAALSFENLTVGKTRATVRSTLLSAYGKPLTGIMKGNCRYSVSNTEQKDIFFNGTSYTTIFYDNIEGGILTSIQIIAKDTELSIGYYGTPSAELASGFERVSFYLVNAIRVRRGLKAMVWDDKMATIARAHSKDMYVRNYFSHDNPDGLSSSARFRAAGLSYSMCSENIAKNHPSAINAHESFMNSAGHRSNILRGTLRLGVGVYIVKGAVLLTQDFITYK